MLASIVVDVKECRVFLDSGSGLAMRLCRVLFRVGSSSVPVRQHTLDGGLPNA